MLFAGNMPSRELKFVTDEQFICCLYCEPAWVMARPTSSRSMMMLGFPMACSPEFFFYFQLLLSLKLSCFFRVKSFDQTNSNNLI